MVILENSDAVGFELDAFGEAHHEMYFINSWRVSYVIDNKIETEPLFMPLAGNIDSWNENMLVKAVFWNYL